MPFPSTLPSLGGSDILSMQQQLQLSRYNSYSLAATCVAACHKHWGLLVGQSGHTLVCLESLIADETAVHLAAGG